jgi:hypothetical protein
MALNAALIVEPEHPWGRTYVEHVEALATDAGVPQAVREACQRLLHTLPADLVPLRTPRGHAAFVDAARDVIAHAWAVVKRHEAPLD